MRKAASLLVLTQSQSTVQTQIIRRRRDNCFNCPFRRQYSTKRPWLSRCGCERERERERERDRAKSQSFYSIFWTSHDPFGLFKIPASFWLFSSFSRYNFNNTNWKSVDGVLGLQTRGCRMVGECKTTELWRLPSIYFILCVIFSQFND